MGQQASAEVRSIQYLRGLAAMLVVFYHASAKTDWMFNPLPALHFGMGGVDVFFVISGFVMYVAARRERPIRFWYKRVLRIAPLYWLATALFFAMRSGHFGEPGLDGAAFVRSLLFVPYRAVPPDGPVWPVLVPGWTLNVEMLFYLLFGIGLAVSRPALVSGLAIVALIAAGFVLAPAGAAATLYTQPILIEFVVGMALGAVFVRGRYPPETWPLAPLGLALLLASDVFGASAPIGRGVGGVALVAGCLGAEVAGRVPRSPVLKRIGDASYSIYLVHTPLLLVMWIAYRRVPLVGWFQFLVFMAGALVASALAGMVVHGMVERPLARWAGSRRRVETDTNPPEPVNAPSAAANP